MLSIRSVPVGLGPLKCKNNTAQGIQRQVYYVRGFAVTVCVSKYWTHFHKTVFDVPLTKNQYYNRTLIIVVHDIWKWVRATQKTKTRIRRHRSRLRCIIIIATVHSIDITTFTMFFPPSIIWPTLRNIKQIIGHFFKN